MRRRKARTPGERARLRAKFGGGGHDWREDFLSSASPHAWRCSRCGLTAVDRHRPPRSFQESCMVRQVIES